MVFMHTLLFLSPLGSVGVSKRLCGLSCLPGLTHNRAEAHEWKSRFWVLGSLTNMNRHMVSDYEVKFFISLRFSRLLL